MSKGQKALVTLMVILNIPVLVLGLNGWTSNNEILFVSGHTVLTLELIIGFVWSLIYIIDNW